MASRISPSAVLTAFAARFLFFMGIRPFMSRDRRRPSACGGGAPAEIGRAAALTQRHFGAAQGVCQNARSSPPPAGAVD